MTQNTTERDPHEQLWPNHTARPVAATHAAAAAARPGAAMVVVGRDTRLHRGQAPRAERPGANTRAAALCVTSAPFYSRRDDVTLPASAD